MLKLEFPLLHSDNERDIRRFGSTEIPNFTNQRIPLEVVNEEKDEGLQWPSKYSAYAQKCYAQAQSEKLSVSKDDLVFLQNIVRDPWTDADPEAVKKESLSHSRVRTTRSWSY